MSAAEVPDGAQHSRERVWDKFLTEQDRAHVARRPRSGKGFGQRPALLLIDLYRSVFGDEPQPLLEAVDTWPSTCGLAAWNAIPHLQRLLAAARTAGIPIVHTTGASDRPWFRGTDADPDRAADPAKRDRLQRRYDIIDEVAPSAGELVIRKSAASAFLGTPIVGYLVDRGIGTIIVGGESTSGCVRASVVDGCGTRFHMVVVEECVFDRHEACHAINLFDMNQKYADVIQLDEALAYLDRTIEARDEASPTAVTR
jgi:nicotinamidase-related amidase